jgi:integrase
MKTRLTASVAAAAKPRQRRYSIWDSEIAGFGLRISPNGVRTWIVKYRTNGGGRTAPQRMLTLGPYTALSSTEARQRARKVKADASLGGDAASALTAQRREVTIEQLVEFYANNGLFVQRGIRLGQPMKAQTAQYTLARLRNHVVPLLGKKRLADLTEGDVERFARDVAARRTARTVRFGARTRIVRGGEGAARKVIRDLSALISFAQHERLIVHNPVATSNVRKTDNRRERYLTLAELGRLGAALEEIEAAGANPKAVAIIRLWVLTGARRNEIAGLRWREVDLDRGLMTLDDTKTGRSVRPLGAAALKLLKSRHQTSFDSNAFVFPAERGDGFYTGTKRIWPLVTTRADLKNVTPHTLRHTLGSVAASSGEALLMIGSMLGHSNARSTQRYAHVDRDPARLATDRATRLLADALGLTANPDRSGDA